MPKKPAQTSPVATISPEVLDKHPLMLTRALPESEAPIVTGEYTLETLRSTFGVEGDQDAVLLELSTLGHAFFNQGGTFYAFTPKQGDLNLPIESEEMAADEPAIVIIDPDELAEINGSVYDPDGEGEPDYAPLVEEERRELEERQATPAEEAINPNPTHFPHAHPEPAIAPTDNAPTVKATPAADDLQEVAPTETEDAMDF